MVTLSAPIQGNLVRRLEDTSTLPDLFQDFFLSLHCKSWKARKSTPHFLDIWIVFCLLLDALPEFLVFCPVVGEIQSTFDVAVLVGDSHALNVYLLLCKKSKGISTSNQHGLCPCTAFIV